jgi:hypothetical protein
MKIAKFAEWILREGPFSGCDIDGGDVQDKAVMFGLLTEVAYDPKIHGESEWDNEPGDPWYVFSDEFKAAIKEAAD